MRVPFLSATPAGLFLAVRVVPKSSRRGIVGVVGDRLKVALHAAPERGKANRELVELMAELLGCPVRAVRLAAGETSRDKTLEIEDADGICKGRILALLEAHRR